ncbi:MAG: M2 family metallopeptidase, partial [Henriciella sp.]|nr:M2 family metallopeptidase [Henriciella sp.]
MRFHFMAGAAALALGACAGANTQSGSVPDEPTEISVAGAQAYIDDAEAAIAEMNEYAARVYWNQATNISFDTNWLAAKAGAESTTLSVNLANGTKQFEGLDLPPVLARKMQILRSGIVIPAPSTEGAAEELANITTGLAATYGTGTFEYRGEELTLDQLSTIIETSRDPAELK